jgi:hypothetical protein
MTGSLLGAALCIAWCGAAFAQGGQRPSSEYTNGALVMAVEAASPEPGDARPAGALFGVLKVRLRNISPETLRIVVSNPDCDFAIDIRDVSSRAPAKMTPLGERLLPKSDAERENCQSISHGLVRLQPGKEYSMNLSLPSRYVIERGPEYNVKLTWVKGLPAATPSGRPISPTLSQTATVRWQD